MAVKKTTGKEFISKNRIAIGIVMMAFSIILGVLILPKIGSRQITYPVVTLSEDVKKNTAITAEMVKVDSTSDAVLASRCYSKIDDVSGLVISHDLSKNSFVQKSDLKDTKKKNTDVVPEGKEVISIPIASLASSVSYMIDSGDIVRFYTVNEDEIEVPKTLQYVEIYNIYDANGVAMSDSTETVPASISLIATQEQCSDLVSSIGMGAHLSLISKGDGEKADAFLKYQDIFLQYSKDYIPILDKDENITNLDTAPKATSVPTATPAPIQ